VNREEQVVHKFCCQWCSAHMGDVTSAGLVMGGGRFQKAVTMCCLVCSRSNKWYPSADTTRHRAAARGDQNAAVASLIQQSISQADKQRFVAAKETRPPRRDAYIDAAEEEADNLLYESIANTEKAKKRA
jgi:hypothetical protein